MARPRKNQSKTTKKENLLKKGQTTSARVSRNNPATPEKLTPFEKVQKDLSLNQSSFSLILGILIVVVVGIIIYNFFNKPSAPASTPQVGQTQGSGDVDVNHLPGKYTVKDGDTLSSIAQHYYNDMSQYQAIEQANNLTTDLITPGQILQIPQLSGASPMVSPSDTSSPTDQPTASPSDPNQQSNNTVQPVYASENTNMTDWGSKITSDTYTVQTGDWLSKIAGRAYGDIYSFQKIAQANNISDPNVIEPGTVLKIPRS